MLSGMDGARGQAHLFWNFTNLTDDEADIDIFDVIGADGWWEDGIKASDFVKELRGITAKRINLHINSPGGYINDGLAMFQAIRQHAAETVALVESQAASIASVVAMAADKVLIAKNAQIFIHDAWGFGIGNAADFLNLASVLDEESNNIADIYAEKAGGTREDWRAAMQENNFGKGYRGQEAVEAGLADDLIAETKPRNLQPVRIAAMARLAEIPRVKDEQLTVCMVPDCDGSAAVAMPMCKEHIEEMMSGPDEDEPPMDAFGATVRAVLSEGGEASFASNFGRALEEARA